MTTPNPVLTTIIFVFALQAIGIGGLLLLKRPRQQANVFLALLVLFFALMALNIALVNVMRANDAFETFRYIQLELLFGIGPALYFYTKSITNTAYIFSKKDAIHFVPVILEFVFYRTAFYRLGADGMYQTPAHPYTKIYLGEQWLGILSISVYTVLSLQMLFRHRKWLKQQYSNLEKRSQDWLKIPVLVFSTFWIGWNLLTEFDRLLFDRSLRETYFLPAFVSLAAVTYWIGLKGYIRSRTTDYGLVTPMPKANGAEAEHDANLAKEITTLMELEQPYLNPDLDLSGLSERLGRNPRHVSHTINRSFTQNFYEYVNSFRVEAFKSRVSEPGSERLTLLGHAFECGFNSKSTFNDVFKKSTGHTPSAYVRQVQKRSEKMHSDD